MCTRSQPPKIGNKVTPQVKAAGTDPAPRHKAQQAAHAHKKDDEVDDEADDEVLDPSSDVHHPRAKVNDAQKQKAQPVKIERKGSAKSDAAPKSRQSEAKPKANGDEDAELQRVLLLSMKDAQSKGQDSGDVIEYPDLEAVLRESAKEAGSLDDDSELEAVLRKSEEEALKAGVAKPVIADDAALKAALLQSEKEAKLKEESELAKALKLSQGAPALQSALLVPVAAKLAAPQPPAAKTPAPPTPVANTPAPQPPAPPPVAKTPAPQPPAPPPAPKTPAPQPPAPKTPVLYTPNKKGTPVDEALLETAKAKSDVCADSLNLAVEKAKENKKIRIINHEIKRNDATNAYLVLHFASEVNRNLAVEELRTTHKMFQTKEPSRVGTTILELTVEQTIEFQNSF